MGHAVVYMRNSMSGQLGGQLGAVADARGVKLRVSGSLNFIANLGISSAEDNIKNALNGKGWEVTDVNAITTLWYPGQNVQFHVYANVRNAFNDLAIVTGLKRDLEGLMSNLSVAVVDAGQVQYVSGENKKDDKPGFDFWTALGISTPIAIVGGGLLLLLLLKR